MGWDIDWVIFHVEGFLAKRQRHPVEFIREKSISQEDERRDLRFVYIQTAWNYLSLPRDAIYIQQATAMITPGIH